MVPRYVRVALEVSVVRAENPAPENHEERDGMMSMALTDAQTGRFCRIRTVGGQERSRLYLERLGFVPGEYVSIVSRLNGNMIVTVKDSRIALSSELASNIGVI